MQKIAIIGAGPTGIFTALQLCKIENLEIHLFEQNKDIGEKLKIAGGGRMNVANKSFSEKEFFSSSERLKKNFFKNPQTKTPEEVFRKIHMKYFWEGKRAILQSENGREEVQRLKEMLEKQKNISLWLGEKVEKIQQKDNKFKIISEKKSKDFDICIISTGGMFRLCEKNTDKDFIYSLPKLLGHSITNVSPSLSPIRVQNHLFSSLAGVSLVAKIFSEEKHITDDLLITHFGFSGPAALDFSAVWSKGEKIFINFLPHITQEEFQKQLRDKENGKKIIKNVLKNFFPQRLAEKFLEISDIESQKKCAEISKREEKKLVQNIFSSRVENPQLFPYNGTWTTKGGIKLEEIFLHSLESKKVKNLFFGGEIIDINGLCGGFHISLAAICSAIIFEEISKKF